MLLLLTKNYLTYCKIQVSESSFLFHVHTVAMFSHSHRTGHQQGCLVSHGDNIRKVITFGINESAFKSIGKFLANVSVKPEGVCDFEHGCLQLLRVFNRVPKNSLKTSYLHHECVSV